MKGNYRVKEPVIPRNPPVCLCRRAVGKPGVIDGDLTKDFWKTADWMDDFHDIEGDSLPRPWKRTQVKVLWDDEALYVGAQLFDDTIWATETDPNKPTFVDNDFEVFLAPQDSSHRYYEMEINALNTLWDLYIDRPQRDCVRRILSWDILGLEHAVKIDGKLNDPSADNRCWCVELKIPWFSLRECGVDECYPTKFAPKAGEIWRMDFSRVEYEVDVIENRYVKRPNLPEHNWLWAPTGVIDAHMPEMWGYLVFTEAGESYPLPAADEAKWLLRRLYYKEHIYSCEHHCFTADAKALLGDEADALRVYITPTLFEGILPFGETEWHIDQDGYIWEGDQR